MRRRRLCDPWLCAALLLGSACDSTDPIAAGCPEPGGSADDCCPAGAAPGTDGAANGPPACCPAGTAALAEGCAEAGVPAALCADGFVTDGAHGCEVVLPAAPCPPGQLAIAGDAACQELTPCGAGRWGDTPPEGGTQFVDGAYLGAASDGSADRPWTTVQAGIDAAAPGGQIAVAAGRYAEELRIEGKAVRVRGRCAAMVEIAGVTAGAAVMLVLGGASGSTISDLALTGPNLGILVSGATDVSLSQLYLHDLGGRGIEASDDLGPSSLYLRRALIERTRDVAVAAFGLPVSIEDSVIRDVATNAAGTHGWGLLATEGTFSGLPAELSVTRSRIESASSVGLQVTGSDVRLEGVVIRDTRPEDDGSRGSAIHVRAGAAGRRSAVQIRSCLLTDNREVGVFVEGSDVTLEGTVVRGTLPNAAGGEGHNLFAQPDPSGARPTLTVSQSLVRAGHASGVGLRGADVTLTQSRVVDTGGSANGGMGVSALADVRAGPSTLVVQDCAFERNTAVGILVSGTTAQIDHTLVDGTRSTGLGAAGHGVHVKPSTETRAPASLRLSRSTLTHNQGGGLMVLSADASVDLCRIADTQPYGDGQYGVGIGVFLDPTYGVAGRVDVTRSLLEDNHDAGMIVWGSLASLSESTIRRTRADARGRFGDGVEVALAGAAIDIRTTRIEHNARAGVSSFGAKVQLQGVTLACNTIDSNAERDLPAGGTDAEAAFDDRGDNVCGCGSDEVVCGVESSGLEAPEPIDESLP